MYFIVLQKMSSCTCNKSCNAYNIHVQNTTLSSLFLEENKILDLFMYLQKKEISITNTFISI